MSNLKIKLTPLLLGLLALLLALIHNLFSPQKTILPQGHTCLLYHSNRRDANSHAYHINKDGDAN